MLHRNRTLSPGSALLLFVSETLLLIGCYSGTAYLVLGPQEFELYLLFEEGLLTIGLVVAVIQASLYTQSFYQIVLPQSRLRMIQQFSLMMGTALFAQALLGYIDPFLLMPRAVMFYGSLLVLFVLSAWRMLFAGVLKYNRPAPKRILLAGSSPSLLEIAELATMAPLQEVYAVAGYIAAEPAGSFPAPWLGTPKELYNVIRAEQPDHLVIARNYQGIQIASLLDLQWSSGLAVEESKSFYEKMLQRVSLLEVDPADLILAENREPSSSQYLLSSVASIVAVVLVSPLLLLITALLKLTRSSQAEDAAPVLLRLPRVGKQGVPFVLYRFACAADPDSRQFGDQVRMWICQRRLDRLPELFNVLRGELAFVGPLPTHPAFLPTLEKNIPLFPQTYSVRPGIFSWADLNLRNHGQTRNQTVPDIGVALAYDLYYISHWNLTLDLYILIHSLFD